MSNAGAITGILLMLWTLTSLGWDICVVNHILTNKHLGLRCRRDSQNHIYWLWGNSDYDICHLTHPQCWLGWAGWLSGCLFPPSLLQVHPSRDVLHQRGWHFPNRDILDRGGYMSRCGPLLGPLNQLSKPHLSSGERKMLQWVDSWSYLPISPQIFTTGLHLCSAVQLLSLITSSSLLSSIIYHPEHFLCLTLKWHLLGKIEERQADVRVVYFILRANFSQG